MVIVTTGKNVLVIGATGGVGKVTASKLKSAGYRVIATCRTELQRKQLKTEEICDIALQMDLADNHSIEAAFRTLHEGGIESLAGAINCAAHAPVEALEAMPQEDIEALFQINVFGALLAAKLSIPLLRKAQGRLIMVGSVGGTLAFPLLGAYSASKFAIEAICDTLRRELEPWKIHVSMVNPEAIKTDMARNQIKQLEDIISSPQQGIRKDYMPLYTRHKKMMQLGLNTAVSAERVADDIYLAMTQANPKTRYFPGVEPTVVSMLSKYLPDNIKDKLLEQIYPQK